MRDEIISKVPIHGRLHPKESFEGEYVDEDSYDNEAKAYVEAGYNGEFRYCNKPPQEIQRLLASEQDLVEREALQIAKRFWDMQKSFKPCGTSESGILDEVAEDLL